VAAVIAAVLLLVLPLAHAAPPREAGTFRAPDLVDLAALDPTIELEIRYATSRNLAGRPVYNEPRAFLQRPAKHNRGCAVDQMLYRRETGHEVEMRGYER
jgi:D-alanyl-D-alanine dipeptidase